MIPQRCLRIGGERIQHTRFIEGDEMGDIRVGLIGVDTSHTVAFTEIFHDPHHKHHVPGVKVVACYPTTSSDIPKSANRAVGFQKRLIDDHGVDMVDSAAALADQVDAVMIASVDGRRHLKEFEQVAEAGKPVFIDKPFTAGLADAKKIAELVMKLVSGESVARTDNYMMPDPVAGQSIAPPPRRTTTSPRPGSGAERPRRPN